MRPAASAPVESLDRDDPQRAAAFGRFTQAEVGRGVLERDHDRPRLGADFRAAFFRPIKPLGLDRGGGHFDGGCHGTHVEADCRDVEQLNQDSREQMLAGVLLHVIEPARPIDLALDFFAAQGCVQNVSDPVFFVHDLANGDAAALPRSDRTPCDPDRRAGRHRRFRSHGREIRADSSRCSRDALSLDRDVDPIADDAAAHIHVDRDRIAPRRRIRDGHVNLVQADRERRDARKRGIDGDACG